MLTSSNDWLSVKSTAEILGVTTQTIRNWERQGKLNSVRHPINKYRLFDRRIVANLAHSSFQKQDPAQINISLSKENLVAAGSIISSNDSDIVKQVSEKLFVAQNSLSQCIKNSDDNRVIKWAESRNFIHNSAKNIISILGNFHPKVSNDSSPSMADLFCGAGGLSLGFEQAGFHPTVAIDNDPAACATYAINRLTSNRTDIFCGDIETYLKINNPKKVDICIGGPPCQGFSNANRHKSTEFDSRNTLFKQYLEFIEASKPNIAVIENVPGMSTYLQDISKIYKILGYACRPYEIQASEYGFPQNRRRLFIIAIKSKFHSIKFFDKISYNLGASALEPRIFLLRDAIEGLPSLLAKRTRNDTDIESPTTGFVIGKFHNFNDEYSRLINGDKYAGPILNHKTKYNNDRDIEIYGSMRQGEKGDSPRISHLIPYKSRSHIFRDKFSKLQYNGICKTITAHMYYDCHMYIHPTQARGITPRESARIQGFPDSYFFTGQPNEWYRQIGNAVSPIMGRLIASTIKKSADELNINIKGTHD